MKKHFVTYRCDVDLCGVMHQTTSEDLPPAWAAVRIPGMEHAHLCPGHAASLPNIHFRPEEGMGISYRDEIKEAVKEAFHEEFTAWRASIVPGELLELRSGEVEEGSAEVIDG